jgi:serine phosphatase RsbU (regulator of sigma subunit)
MFTPHQLILEAEDCLYMFSDGYADQFGGAKGKKFMVKQFHENLKTIHNMDMFDQHTYLEMRLDDWKGNLEQIDDVLVIGIKV